MECSKCRQNNKEYHNYCGNDGEFLDYYAKNVVLKSHTDSHCKECGSKISETQTYCGECGNLIDKIQTKNVESIKASIVKEESKSYFDLEKLNFKNFKTFNFKNLDMRGIALSLALTLILSSILIAVMINVSIPEEILKASSYDESSISKFKLFMMNLVGMHGIGINMSYRVTVMNVANISIISRCIINILIMILIMSISARICCNKDEIKGKTLEHSILYAVIYSIIMVIIGALSGTSMSVEEGIGLTINAKLGSAFINSLFISFTGVYMGISRGENRTEISILFKKSFKTIVVGFIITSVILGIILYTELNKTFSVSEMIKYYFDFSDTYKILFIVSLLSVVGSWLFALSNFASFSILGIISYNIFSLSSEMNIPMVLFVIVPAVLLVFVGRKLKANYRNNYIQIIGMFSGMYSILMVGFAYFSRIIISANLGNLQNYFSDFIYGAISTYSYEYADIVNGYIDKISSTLNSGLTIGPNIFLMMISSFIFSFICVYFGYKSKKID